MFLFLFLLPVVLQAADDNWRFRVFLKDKNAAMEGIHIPELSSAAWQRRENQGLEIDSTDYPVSKIYLEGIRGKGCTVVAFSRWMNTVVVSVPDSSCVEALFDLPYVRSVQLVWVNPSVPFAGVVSNRVRKQTYVSDVPDAPVLRKGISDGTFSEVYGMASLQNTMLGVDVLHQGGYKGAGITVAVVDGGFIGADTMSWFKDASIVAVRDFIYPPSSVYNAHSHGTSVLSVMATNTSGVLVGTAPEASYCLLRSEDVSSEFPIEEDYWAEAVEFADSIGADIVTSSLGYTEFDVAALSYQTDQLDGKTAFISRVASMAARKGMLVVCSAGNEGNTSWKKIDFPADADSVLAVGAIGVDSLRTWFSSVGPTVDGRIKPDVVAMGLNTSLLDGEGMLTTGSGTSFSAPLVTGMAACLWQAFPRLKSQDLLQCLRKAGDRASVPDVLYGYGIPNAWRAMLSLGTSPGEEGECLFVCYPNPVRDKLYVFVQGKQQQPVNAVVRDFSGREIESKIVCEDAVFDATNWQDSVYLVDFLAAGQRVASRKVIVCK